MRMALSMDSILKLSRSKKITILVAILVLILGLYYTQFYLPQQEELNALKGKLGDLIKKLEESKAIDRELEKFKEQVEKLNAELKVARTQLPSEKEIPEILKNISSLGKDSSLEFTLFRPKPEEPQQFYARVPIELSFLGNYHNIGMFFDKVSKQPRIINVADFSMARPVGTKGSDESMVRASCLLTTYRFLEKKPEDKKGEKNNISSNPAEGGQNAPTK
jgi:type IV pilus assembly protein PilO